MLQEDIIEVFVGLVATFLLSWVVKPILDRITKADKPAPPKGMEQPVWDEIIDRGSGGKWLGWLERFFSFGAFWIGAHVVLAGWLAFKVAAKWETWRNIVQFPAKLSSPEYEEVDYLKARSGLGTLLFAKFTVGTLLNVSIGFVGYVLGRNSYDTFALVITAIDCWRSVA